MMNQLIYSGKKINLIKNSSHSKLYNFVGGRSKPTANPPAEKEEGEGEEEDYTRLPL